MPALLSGWGGEGLVGEGSREREVGGLLPLNRRRSHANLLAIGGFRGVPRGFQLLPPVFRLRPGKRHYHVLCTLVDGVLRQLAELAADYPRVGAQEFFLAGGQI